MGKTDGWLEDFLEIREIHGVRAEIGKKENWRERDRGRIIERE